MKLSKEHKKVLTFKFKDTWYTIIQKKEDSFELYRVIEIDKDFEYLGKGNNPKKLEDKVYDGKLK